MFNKNAKIAIIIAFFTFGLISAAPLQKCLENSELDTKLDHHKLKYLVIDKIFGKDLNVDCLKNVEFSSIKVAGLRNYRLCALNQNLRLRYTSISIKGQYKAPSIISDTSTYDEGIFMLKLTDLVINYSINDESENIIATVQLGSVPPLIDIPTNDSLMKCLSSTESLMSQLVTSHAKNELKTVIDENWSKIEIEDKSLENSLQDSEETTEKKKVIVFYYGLMKSLHLRDNT